MAKRTLKPPRDYRSASGGLAVLVGGYAFVAIIIACVVAGLGFAAVAAAVNDVLNEWQPTR